MTGRAPEDPALSARRFFDGIAPRYDRLFAPDAAATAHDLGALLVGAPRGGLALDLGCGTGRAWPHLLAAGLRTIAIDTSLPMLHEAGRRVSAADVIRVRTDVYAAWPIADRSIDVVLALHAVLAHPPGDPWLSWRAVGAEIARVARAGALIAIDLPDPDWARRTLHPLDHDRYLHREGTIDVVVVVPDTARVLAALGLALTCVESPTGVRAVGRIGAPGR